MTRVSVKLEVGEFADGDYQVLDSMSHDEFAIFVNPAIANALEMYRERIDQTLTPNRTLGITVKLLDEDV